MTRALIFLTLIELFAFGLFSHRLGFYHDDWHLLEVASAARDLSQTFSAFSAAGVYASRPANLLWLSLLYRWGGLNPLFYQATLLGLDILQSLLLFMFLRKLNLKESFSLLAAALALMSPTRAVTHVWFANAPQGIALVLALAALVLHQGWLARRQTLTLAAGQSLYLLSLLTYESAAFLPLMLGGGLAARYACNGDDPRQSLFRAARELAPFALTLLAAMLWQRVGLPLFTGAASPKSLGFSAAHALKAYGAGLECLTNRVIHACWKALPGALDTFGLLLLLPCVALSLLLAKILPLERPISSPAAVSDWKTALGAAGLGFFGAYAPYALSSSYMPQAFGLMSRTNAAGALVLGILLAAATARLVPKAQLALTVILACAFTIANWWSAAQWSRSWSLQQKILEKATPHIKKIPENSVIILKGAPSYVGHAIVFDASWDFGPALRLKTGRKNLTGTVFNARMKAQKGALVEESASGTQSFPYEKLYFYDYELDRLSRP